MVHPERIVLALLLLIFACRRPPPTEPSDFPTDAAVKTSARASVRFKRYERLNADLARTLGLGADEVCLELGSFSCAAEVHRVTLGGSDPYSTGLYEGFKETGPSTPLAVERLVLSACQTRVERDLASPTRAVVFRGIHIDDEGKLDPSSKPVRDAIFTLYREGLLRVPTTSELAHLSELYAAIDAEPLGAEPGPAFLALACFSVLTTSEFLFF